MPCIEEIIKENELEIQEKTQELEKTAQLSRLVLQSLNLSSFLAAKLVEKELKKRNDKICNWPKCEKCGEPIENKGTFKRQLVTLAGMIHFSRKVGRCKNGCQTNQYAPLDKSLGITDFQRASNKLRYAACMLAVFIPYLISSNILKALTGIKVSAKTIWNWSQEFGSIALEQTKLDITYFKYGYSEGTENLDREISCLPLVIGCEINGQDLLDVYGEKSKIYKSYQNLCSYLLYHMPHIDYQHFKFLGLPIGSGMVESSCKWLVTQRFKCSEMKWSESGFNRLLFLRLAWVNDRFDDLFFPLA